ncbi:hypothetical protein CFC21_034233 [Triticum aestivum]|uniref:Peptidase A1 domain-containing protein n=3 Tax=Triticum TaxID=4564 RepID=A0A9R0RCD8_TRITD|nr:aspartic proteinase CDR1-like [Triticum dicoccoides]XP_044335992.1 aspartic proteinase CDR1-like [Triticum aestivum]KAF7021251.1 hypothetical protein CFC21_034233 [Triticum aestivum]VAH57483.1 unnamed protein product [Triticum turgidum subsp. durum]
MAGRALLLAVVVLTAQLCGCTAYVGDGGGFSVEFIHRDSPKSPFHDPSLTSYDRVLAAVRRSRARSRSYAGGGSPGGAVSEVVSAPFEYLMYVNVGTPRTRMLALVDTGSDVVWFKCSNGTAGPAPLSAVFDPSSSSSYGLVGCRSDSCRAIYGTSCGADSFCRYRSTYSDGSTTAGILSTETFTFDDAPGGCVGCRERPQLQVPGVSFGCATSVTGKAFRLTGNVGLGAGSGSLVNQIGAATSLGRRFSYCLAPFFVDASSILSFGARAAVTEPGAVTTPLVPSAVDAFYTILLASVKVGNSTVVPPRRSPVIVDSGTVLTYLDKGLLEQVVAEVARSIKLPRKQSPEKLVDLCYDVAGESPEAWAKLLPEVTLGFGGGAAITLPARNAFVEARKGTVCLAMSAVTDDGPAVATIGSIAQQGFHVGFDLDKRAITFAAADCASSYSAPPAAVSL